MSTRQTSALTVRMQNEPVVCGELPPWLSIEYIQHDDRTSCCSVCLDMNITLTLGASHSLQAVCANTCTNIHSTKLIDPQHTGRNSVVQMTHKFTSLNFLIFHIYQPDTITTGTVLLEFMNTWNPNGTSKDNSWCFMQTNQLWTRRTRVERWSSLCILKDAVTFSSVICLICLIFTDIQRCGSKNSCVNF